MTILAIFTLRTYAIYGKSWIVLFLLAVPALLNMASGIVRLFPVSVWIRLRWLFAVANYNPDPNRASIAAANRAIDL